MSADDLSLDDVEARKTPRDSDGNLIPNEYTLDWFGEEKTVKTRPFNAGLLNELSEIDDEIMALDPAAVAEFMRSVYVEPDFSAVSAEDVADYPPDVLNTLIRPLEEELPNDDAEGN